LIAQAEFLLTQQLPKTNANVIANERQGLQAQDDPAHTVSSAAQALPNTTKNLNQHIFKSAELRLPTIESSKFNGDLVGLVLEISLNLSYTGTKR